MTVARDCLRVKTQPSFECGMLSSCQMMLLLILHYIEIMNRAFTVANRVLVCSRTSRGGPKNRVEKVPSYDTSPCSTPQGWRTSHANQFFRLALEPTATAEKRTISPIGPCPHPAWDCVHACPMHAKMPVVVSKIPWSPPLSLNVMPYGCLPSSCLAFFRSQQLTAQQQRHRVCAAESQIFGKQFFRRSRQSVKIDHVCFHLLSACFTSFFLRFEIASGFLVFF